MSPPALITQAEWNEHVELEGKVLGQYSRLDKTTTLLTNEVARLVTVAEKLERRLAKAERRTDSLSDEIAVEDKARAMVRKWTRAFRAWVGWAIGVGAGLYELYKALH